jgi:Zn-dependent protease
VFGEPTFIDGVIGLAVLLVSIVLHENAHGVVALWLGDDTAKKTGRLTLNPIKHLDIVGSLIIPAALYFANQPMFGYAKPVPVSPSKLRGTDRVGFATVAAAGPVSNIIIAFLAVLAAKALGATFTGSGQIFVERAPGMAMKIALTAYVWNITLAAFNLLPIPPLDGSRFLRPFLKPQGRQRLDRIEPYGFLILFALLYFLREPLFRIIDVIQRGIINLLPL